MSGEEPLVGVVEFNRRMMCAVWGLAITLALSGWTAAPWVEVDGEQRVLWEVALEEDVGWPGGVLATVMAVTLVLGVAASAAGTKPVARAAWISGLVVAGLIFVFLGGSADFDVAYGAWYAWPMALVFSVVFFLVSRSGGDPERARKIAAWMDPSFGTVDKRYRRRR